MATMTCEPLGKDLLYRMRFDLGTPTRSVMVEVGEGLDPGSRWWLVILDSPPDDSYQWGLRRFLTNALDMPPDVVLEPGELGGHWISIPPDDPWVNVKWDSERLARAQSALAKAQECLDA